METKYLYGITDDELNEIIGRELVRVTYETRINQLKKHLAKIREDKSKSLDGLTPMSVYDQMERIQKAMSFWERLKR